MFIVVLVLLAVYFLIRLFGKSQDHGRKRFKGASFDSVRKEVNKGELKQDPISGTYVSEEDAIKVVKDGKEYYFASEENAEKFTEPEG